MVFSSIPFLYYFLPAVLVLYFIVPNSLKNIVLLLASLFFYGWGEPRLLVLIIVSVSLGYVFGLLIDRTRGKGASRLYLVLSLICSLGFLLYFKYADFFIESFNSVFSLSIPLLRVALPIGISFYTFQIISYTIDVYRGSAKVQRNPLTLATYIAMFPQLIAGPIVRYSDVARQLEKRSYSFDMASYGIRRFITGLAKKVLLANNLGLICTAFAQSGEKSVLFYWLYAVAFSLQIYYDFSGYSDMAIGLGKILGFDFSENFNYPFISSSVTEFWRRWHISLGTWFRDYVYIPLGGSRVAKPKAYLNIFIVWMLTGLWHGAAWNFVLWGVLYAVLLIIEKLWLLKPLERHKWLGHIYVIFTVLISFVVFNANGMGEVFTQLGGMFGFNGVPIVGFELLYTLRSNAVLLVAACIGATPLVKRISETIRKRTTGERALNILEPLWLLALLLVVTGYLVGGSFNPFLYFRF